MALKTIIRKFFKLIKMLEEWSEDQEKTTIYTETLAPHREEFFSVWDALRFKENTQAYHLNGVVGFEEWVDMEEIRRRIKELFGVEYKNFRSLYPYIKTLVDIGLMETTDVGGKRKWRKTSLFVKIKQRENKEKIEVREKKDEKA